MSQLNIRVVNTQAEHVQPLADLQRVVFPTLNPGEWFTAEMFRAQIDAFPDGQLVALADTPGGTRVIGGTTTFRTSRIFEGDAPYYFEVIGEGYLTTHEPDGEWLYGVDVNVHPDFRRMSVGSRIYDARREVVRRLNLRGEVVAGLLPGYDRVRDQMRVEDYAARVAAGELTDPTMSMQLRNGFRLKRLLYGYVHDPRSNDVCTLLVRPNLDYRT